MSVLNGIKKDSLGRTVNLSFQMTPGPTSAGRTTCSPCGASSKRLLTLLTIQAAVLRGVRHGALPCKLDTIGLCVVAEFEWEDDSPVNGDWETAVSTSEHHRTDNEFGQRTQSTREGIAGLRYGVSISISVCPKATTNGEHIHKARQAKDQRFRMPRPVQILP